MLENPTISLRKDEATNQILFGGLSTTHLNYMFSRLENEYQIKFKVEQPKISYRETITTTAESEGRDVKQSGGSGYYGIVNMEFSPSDHTEFISTVFGGHIDKGYFPAVEKGFLEALKEGGLIKAPVINVKANLKDGKQHSVDSNEIAFKNAAILAFKEAYKKCNPIILEPYDKIIVIVPSEYLGAILSDLTKRRARILSTDEDEGVNLKVTAIVPESEILEYSNEIKSLSKSTAFFNLSFYDYEQVPELISNKILATYNNEKK